MSSPKFFADIELLSALAVDLAALQDGVFDPLGLGEAPLISDVSIGKRSAVCLRGFVVGHGGDDE